MERTYLTQKNLKNLGSKRLTGAKQTQWEKEQGDTWRSRDMKSSEWWVGGAVSGDKVRQAKWEVVKNCLIKKGKSRSKDSRDWKQGCTAAAQMQNESNLFVES